MSQLASLKAVSRVVTHSSSAAQRGLGRREEVWAGARCAMTAPKFSHFFSFSRLLVVVLGPVSVEELVSIENTPSARFARYGIKINILTCLWF